MRLPHREAAGACPANDPPSLRHVLGHGAVKATATVRPRKEGFQEEVACELNLQDDAGTMGNRWGRVSRRGEQRVQREVCRAV